MPLEVDPLPSSGPDSGIGDDGLPDIGQGTKSAYSVKYDEVAIWLRNLTTPVSPKIHYDPHDEGSDLTFGVLASAANRHPAPRLDRPTQEILDWQVSLVKAGIIAKGTKIHPGLADSSTVSATSTVFRFMKLAGITDPKKAVEILALTGALAAGKTAGEGGGGGGGGAKGPSHADLQFALDSGLARRMGWVK